MQTTRRRHAQLRVLVPSVLVVGVLAAMVGASWGPLLRLDRALSTAVYVGDDRPRAVGVLLEVLTTPGVSWFRAVVLVPVAVGLVVRRDLRRAGFVLVSGWLVGPLTTVVKELVGRVRPPFAEGGARLESLSFPSGHSSGIATLVTVLLILAWPQLRRRGPALALGTVVAVVVAATRLLLGVHYLSDVVAGVAFGVAFTLVTALAFRVLP